MRHVIAVVADMQVGSTVAICPRRVELIDGGIYQPSKAQASMLRYWDKCWQLVYDAAGKDDLLLVANGDLVDGDHHNSYQLWSRRSNDQERAALDLLLEPRQKAKECYLVQGTATHVENGGSSEDRLAQELGAHRARSLHKLSLDVQGVRFLFAHHGPTPGRAEHTRGDAVRRELRNQFYAALRHGYEPPHVCVWSHQHRFIHETISMEYHGRMHVMHGYITPAWQLATQHIHRLERGPVLADVGLMWFVIEGGRMMWHIELDRRDTTEAVRI